MTEFALAIPILFLVLLGIALAWLYVFRASTADWGLYVSAATRAGYDGPGSYGMAFPDLQSAIQVQPDPGARTVTSRIDVQAPYNLFPGLPLQETESGTGVVRLWQFYAGAPAGPAQ
jgi:hypothetical protein